MKEEDEEEEREMDRLQEDVTDSNKQRMGGTGKFQLEDASVKVCQPDW